MRCNTFSDGSVGRFKLVWSQRSREADNVYRLVLSVDICLSYAQPFHLGCFLKAPLCCLKAAITLLLELETV